MIRIGYPCMNTSVGCTSAGSLRVASYSEEKVREKIESNLNCLEAILKYNVEHGISVYRISSDLIPLATHPVFAFDWQKAFKHRFAELGAIIEESGMRVSTHPGQFVLINSPKREVVEASVRELEHQAAVLELFGADLSGKIQIHVGGAYGDKEAAIGRFAESYAVLPQRIKKRLAIENDERYFSIEDCARIFHESGAPVIFDAFHHSINPGALSPKAAFEAARATWSMEDGPQQIDYSQQDAQKQLGAHSRSIDPAPLLELLESFGWPEPLDVMLEVKDKERSVASARKALESIRKRD